MVNKHCVHGDCTSDSRYQPWLKWAAFVKPTVPKNKERAARWIYCLKRADFTIENITKDTFLCEKHFPDEDHDNLDWKTNPNLEPFPHNFVTNQGAKHVTPVKVTRREPKYDISDLREYQWYLCPEDTCEYKSRDSFDFEKHMKKEHNCYKSKMMELDTSGNTMLSSERSKQPVTETTFVELPDQVKHDFENHKVLEISETSPESNVTMNVETMPLENDFIFGELQDGNKTFVFNVDCDLYDKTENCTFQPFLFANSKTIKNLVTKCDQSVQVNSSPWNTFHTDKEEKMYFFTGLNNSQRKIVFDFLGEAKSLLTMVDHVTNAVSGNMKAISVEDQFNLTLCILRRGWTYTEASYMFNINAKTASSVFKTWLLFIYRKFGDIKDQMYTKRCDIPQPLPKCFRNDLLKDVRIIVDGMEIRIEGSINYEEQGNTYSSYKQFTTGKILYGVSPHGNLMFASSVYEGSISDLEISKQSNFTAPLIPGDVVLADRGFSIEPLLIPKGARLIMPAFMKGRDSFDLQEVTSSRLIARARIPVEQFNERVKNWNFFGNRVIPHYYKPLLTPAAFVLACLANLSETLVKQY